MHFDQGLITAKLEALRKAQETWVFVAPELKVKKAPVPVLTAEQRERAKMAKAILKARAKKREEEAKQPEAPREIKPVSLEGKVSLKIDHKTTIFIPVGADPAKYIAKYKKEVDSTKKRLDHMQQQLGYTYQF